MLTAAQAISSLDLVEALAVLVILASAMILLRVRQHVRRSNRQHQQYMDALTMRRDELEAALSSMVQGVIAIDTEGRLLSANDAAVQRLSLSPDRHLGQHIDKSITSHALKTFIHESLNSAEPRLADIELHLPGDARMFQAQASVLRHSDGRRLGSLVVLHDVTRLRRLEVVRQDFVANASHEIRTPVAAIKMAAETLESEGDDADPQTVRRFIRIIARQADRLQALTEDLLSIARIERDTEQRRVWLEERPVLDVLRYAAETCQTAAAHSQATIHIACPDDLTVPMNPPLVEQAIVNLIDNAIKYAAGKADIQCHAARDDGHVVISVTDSGPGIGDEHLPRIFERFYRTDKARSRELGGTGLGLSIVKHVALVHGGRVSVESHVGQGSTFRIYLPLKNQQP